MNGFRQNTTQLAPADVYVVHPLYAAVDTAYAVENTDDSHRGAGGCGYSLIYRERAGKTE